MVAPSCYYRPMTAQQAILIGAGIIGASIVGARALAPYEFTAGVAANGNPFLWRSNRITGEIQNCQLELVSGRPVFGCHTPP
jgi:hypothetical protein